MSGSEILFPKSAVRAEDITQALLEERPQIVHFSGHGTKNGGLCLENATGEAQFVPPDALTELFKQFTGHLRSVILNACYTESQAQAIAKHIPYVIGMSRAVEDRAAIAFSVGFYQALGAGSTIEEAFNLGCVQIGLRGIPGDLLPILIQRRE